MLGYTCTSSNTIRCKD